MKDTKAKCPVCGTSVLVRNGRLTEHTAWSGESMFAWCDGAGRTPTKNDPAETGPFSTRK